MDSSQIISNSIHHHQPKPRPPLLKTYLPDLSNRPTSHLINLMHTPQPPPPALRVLNLPTRKARLLARKGNAPRPIQLHHSRQKLRLLHRPKVTECAATSQLTREEDLARVCFEQLQRDSFRENVVGILGRNADATPSCVESCSKTQVAVTAPRLVLKRDSLSLICGDMVEWIRLLSYPIYPASRHSLVAFGMVSTSVLCRHRVY